MKSKIGVIVELVLAGALFIGCESEPEPVAKSEREIIAAIREIAGSEVTRAPMFKVDLASTKVTDAELEHLKGLTRLEFLVLTNTEVTDAGLTHLEGLTRLQTLYLSGTKVTDDGVAKLQTALPKCQIRR